METGIELIKKERAEQIQKHGYDFEHDAEGNTNDELVKAATYLLTGDEEHWPSEWDEYFIKKFYKKSWIEKLTVAGALIAAEIDRLQLIKKSE